MASWITEYEYFKNNINYNHGKEVLDFFKTNPTDKQILILNKRENKINAVLLITFLYGLIFGGFFLYLFYLFIGVFT